MRHWQYSLINAGAGAQQFLALERSAISSAGRNSMQVTSRNAPKLGFIQAVIPKANAPKQKIPGIEIIAVERVEEAVNRVR